MIYHHLSNLDDLIQSGFEVILKITIADLCKPIQDVTIITVSSSSFKSGNCGNGKKYKKMIILKKKKAF